MNKLLDTSLVAQARLTTPLGPMTAAATARGLAGLWFDGQKHHPGALGAPVDESNRFIAQARRELSAYFADDSADHAARRAGFQVALDPQGTAFQRSVWSRLTRIESGQLARYGQLAAELGRPQAARAVGAAVGRNPLSIIVPCHRVLGQDGSLTGYAGGLPRKRALLQLEGVAMSDVAIIEPAEPVDSAGPAEAAQRAAQARYRRPHVLAA